MKFAALVLSVSLLLPLTPVFTLAAAAAEWKLVDKQEKGYFVPLDQILKRSNSKKTKSELASKGKVKRNETNKTVRESGAPRKAVTNEDVPGAKSLEAKIEGRQQNTYEVWPVVTNKVTTTTTPYVDYELRDWQEATKDTYKNTYEITEELSWQEPVTGNLKTFTRKYNEGPLEEAVQGPWADKTSKTEVARGNDVGIEKQEIGTRNESRKIRSVLATGQGSPVEVVAGRDSTVGFAAEAGKGGASARSSSYQQGLGFSGAARTKSQGGPKGGADFESLLSLASSQPDLYEDGGARPAWKLAADGQAVVFTPYDAAGKLDNDNRVTLAKGERKGSGKQGAQVSVSAVSVSPAVLLGDFKTPKGKQSGRLSAKQ